MRRRGLSILEAVTALFILSGATLTVVAVFHSGMRGQAQVDDRQLALTVAQRQLEELRARALTPAGFRELQNLDGVYRPDAELPVFEVATASTLTGLYSPCSAFAEDQRNLEDTARWVSVGVRWPRAAGEVRLTSLVSEPRRPILRVRVQAPTVIPNPLPRDALLDLEADLLDDVGAPVKGVRFTFWVKPGSANARLKKRKNGKRVELQNKLEPPQFPDDGLAYPAGTTYDGGDTIIVARGLYHGQRVTGYSDPIGLEP